MLLNGISSQTFGTKKLYSVNLIRQLPNKSQEKVKAYISLLERSDSDEITNSEEKFKPLQFGEAFVDCFESTIGYHDAKIADELAKNNKFLIIETDEDKPLFDRLKAFAKMRIEYPKIRLNLLKSHIGEGEFQGCGSSLLYALSKLASARDKAICISVESTKSAVPFYKKHLFKRPPNNTERYFELSKDDYIKMQDSVQSKYDIRPLIPYNKFSEI